MIVYRKENENYISESLRRKLITGGKVKIG
jgi:hypothetical protein